jgi:hypothetical protein
VSEEQRERSCGAVGGHNIRKGEHKAEQFSAICPKRCDVTCNWALFSQHIEQGAASLLRLEILGGCAPFACFARQALRAG